MRNRVRTQVDRERKRRHAIFAAVFVIVAAYVGANFLLGDMGYLSYKKLLGSADGIRTELAGIKDKNDYLRREVDALKNDPNAIEVIARRDLGLAKPGEKIYDYPEEKK